MNTSTVNLDIALNKAKKGDIESIIICLDSHIPVYAFPAILLCYDYGYDSESIQKKLTYWDNCNIEILGRPINSYSRAVKKAFLEGQTLEEALEEIANG